LFVFTCRLWRLLLTLFINQTRCIACQNQSSWLVTNRPRQNSTLTTTARTIPVLIWTSRCSTSNWPLAETFMIASCRLACAHCCA
jgi:hypothetical protein